MKSKDNLIRVNEPCFKLYDFINIMELMYGKVFIRDDLTEYCSPKEPFYIKLYLLDNKIHIDRFTGDYPNHQSPEQAISQIQDWLTNMNLDGGKNE